MSQKKKKTVLRSTGEDACFAASNSAHGFHSYYSDCFDREEIGRLFIIKGGPGTGKSRFMREVSQCGEAHGWSSRMIYCSSDADSLDGVILQKEGDAIALLDGTAPHVYEPKTPGVREELVNLGDFWSSERLRERRDEIRAQNEIKQRGYRMAYRYLSAYEAVHENLREKVTPYLREKAMAEYAKKLLREIPSEQAFQPQTALIGSLGMKGEVQFDTYFQQAKKLYLIEDHRGIAAVFMGELYRLAAEKRLRVRVSRDPILPDVIDGLFLTGSGVAFAVGQWQDLDLPHRKISMRRFMRTAELRAIRETLRFDERMCDTMRNGALEQMEVIRRAHFELENIYTAAMDFDAKENFTKKFCNQLFDLQNS